MRRTIVLPLALAASLSGCISMNSYSDPALPTVRPQDVRARRSPQPVQVLFEFRTKGAPNARATELAKPVAFDTVRSTTLFSNVAETPVAGGRTLTLVIDIVPITEDAASASGNTMVRSMVPPFVVVARRTLSGHDGPVNRLGHGAGR